MNYDFGSISRSRRFLMGIAALWIIAYHSKIFFTASDPEGIAHFFHVIIYNVYQIKTVGQIGVDIFLFLSAVGLYYSMEENHDPLSFYKRRIIRIMPEYLLVGILWELYLHESFGSSLANLCGLSFFTKGYRGYWFFVLIFFLYLLFPFMYRMVKKYGNIVVMIPLLLMLVLNYELTNASSVIYTNIEIALRRVPVFLIGLYIAPYVKQGVKVKSFLIIPFAMAGFLLSYRYLIHHDEIELAYRYVLGLGGSFLIIILSYLHSLLEKKIDVIRVVETCGDHSMEYYLLYERLIYIFTVLIKNNVVLTVVCVTICFTLSVVLKRAHTKLCEKLDLIL